MNHGGVIERDESLFSGPVGGDRALVDLEPAGAGAVLRTQEWGPGVEQHFGWDTIETWTTIGAHALRVLAYALVADRPDLDPTLEPFELVAAALRGDSAASATVRNRLDELELPYTFEMR
jgi:hypothetical protein